MVHSREIPFCPVPRGLIPGGFVVHRSQEAGCGRASVPGGEKEVHVNSDEPWSSPLQAPCLVCGYLMSRLLCVCHCHFPAGFRCGKYDSQSHTQLGWDSMEFVFRQNDKIPRARGCRHSQHL